jgi:glutathionylspermidine synthase
MERYSIEARPEWRERCESLGFQFHSVDGSYWNESACYRFSSAEIDNIEAASGELHAMCLDLVAESIRTGSIEPFNLSVTAMELAERSWRNQELSLYGRFDLAYDGREIKLLEYNADTPTSLLEAAVIQWDWLEQTGGADQFNSLHEKLIARWAVIRRSLPESLRAIYFTSMQTDNAEDWCNLHYLLDTASQAGLNCSWISLEEIGWDGKAFVDVKDQPIGACFKLYPWEWMTTDEFGRNLKCAATRFIEPAWKMLLSNKAILPLLWTRHPGHPLLLPAFFEDGTQRGGDWVRKPLLSREGSNVSFIQDGVETLASYANPAYAGPAVLQQRFALPCMDGVHPVLGAWVVGDDPAGMGIREDANPITGNTSNFVPHYFE